MSISYAGYRTGFPFPIMHRSPNGLPFEPWDGVTVGGSDLFYGAEAASGAMVYGPGTFHPIGFTAGELAELYWRSKTIRLVTNYDFGWYDSPSGGTFNETPIAEDSVIPRTAYVDPITHEANLYKENFFYLNDIEPETTGWTNISFWPSDYWPGGNVMKVGNLYYPSLLVESNGCFTALRGNETGGNFDQPLNGMTAMIFGRELPMWVTSMYPVGTPPKYPPFYGNGSIVLNYDTFFEYNGKWNTSTGAPN